jgi:hypothetical protein
MFDRNLTPLPPLEEKDGTLRKSPATNEKASCGACFTPALTEFLRESKSSPLQPRTIFTYLVNIVLLPVEGGVGLDDDVFV